MILPSDKITAITWVQCCACSNDYYRGIISYLTQTDVNKEGSTVPFINNLEITEIFKDKGEEEEVSVTDFIN